MRVLLIEDDASTAKSLQIAIEAEKIAVDVSDTGEDGMAMAKLYEYDIIILDMMLPDVDGFKVLQNLRLNNVTTPVLVLSGLTGSDNKIKGLGIGADDYVTKPFNVQEIIERIRAIVRRTNGISHSVIEIGDLAIDTNARSVAVKGRKVHLTSKEYAILELMSMRKGTPIKKDSFLDHLYNGIDEPELKIIDVFVCKLRKKIMDASGGDNYIETVWGRGYMLSEPTMVH